jgi:hypothetical protein
VATSVNLGYCAWLSGATYNEMVGNLNNAAEVYLGGTTGGVLQTYVNPLQVNASSGMIVAVNPGSAVIPSSSGPTAGAYTVTSPSTQDLTVATAPSSPNSRIDIICVNVNDLGSSSSYSQLLYVEGTAGTSPSAPSPPSDSIVLCQIFVGSGVSSITQSNITDERIFAVAAGGVLWCPNMASLPSGQAGQLGFDMVNNRLFQLGASGAAPIRVYSFPAAEAYSTSNVVTTYGSLTTVLSTSITSPGGVDLSISASVTDMYSPNNPFAMSFTLYIDSTEVQSMTYYSTSTKIDGTNYRCGGGYITYDTSSVKGTTPAAGAHTIYFKAEPYYMSSGNTVTLYALSYAPIDLFVCQVTI